jgi:hypothetical protein
MNSSQTSPGIFKVNVGEMYGEPGIKFAFKNVGVILSQNGTEILNNSLVAGPMNGTGAILTFTDADANGYIDEGDYFTLTGTPGASYVLKLSRKGGLDLQAETELHPY